MTQERLAEAAQIDCRHVQRIEAGQANLELSTLCHLANALDTTPDLLIALSTETSPSSSKAPDNS